MNVFVKPNEQSEVYFNFAMARKGRMKSNLNAIRTALSVFLLWLASVASADDMAGYLFAYFQGNNTSQEHLFYAVSADGLNYMPLNGGKAVVNFSNIAVAGNVRDPFITRANDGTWLMVCTDMRSSNGWSSNRGMVLSKSTDLVHWTHATVHFPTRYAGTYLENVTRVWAPEVIYDRQAGKYMIYYSILTSDGTVAYDKVFYNYANADFTDLEDMPTHLYDRGSATIDMTIVYNEADQRYHAYYKNEGAGGICHISASSLTAASGAETGSQWSAPSSTVQQTTEAVEGPCIFKRISDGKWMLGYDCYASSPAHFQFCEISSDFATHTKWGDCPNHGAFTPRHGSVIPLTNAELYALDVALGGADELSALKAELNSELSLAETLGGDVAEEHAIYGNSTASRAQIQTAIDNLRLKEYALATANYAHDATHLLGDPAKTNIASNAGQHWDGTSTSTYDEQPGASWSASSWTSSLVYSATLPVGDYLFRVACRASTDVEGTLSANGTTTSIPTNGDTGLGITTAGATSFSPGDTYANGGNGRGWEWRYIPVSVTGTAKNVNFTISASASTVHQWFSVTSIGLFSKNALPVDVISDEPNASTTVGQVTRAVNVTTATDYMVTGATPFSTTGSVNLAHDDAVLILSGVRPSVVISSWLPFVKINGAAAVNGSNCQVKIHGDGTIIMPHGDSFRPLTVFMGNNFTDDANAQYDVSTKYNLDGTPFDNSIRSFTLRRGYSVCLSAKANGLGYSRVWVADSKNLKVDLAGTPLDGTASFVRINTWNDTSKKGWAGGQSTQNALLNTTWYYNWNDNGDLSSPDREYVGIRQQPWWPNPDQASANVLGYNEFDNSVEDSYKELVKIAGGSSQDALIEAAIGRWTDLLVTGKRLGSPCVSNWGNNFSGGMLAKFIDKLEERGYRCDFIVTHSYWYNDWSTWQSWLNDIHNLFPGRQIWITEMNYGANWTGWPGSGTGATAANYNIELQHFGPIIDGLEATDFIERYAVYNDVQECRYMYNASDASLASNNYLTPMGQYYANKASAIGYKADLNTYVPNTSRWMKDPLLASVVHDDKNLTTTLNWSDANGEYIQTMCVEQKVGTTWTVVYTVDNVLVDGGAYSHTLSASEGGTFRIHTVDLCGISRYSAEIGSEGLNEVVGAEVEYDGATYYLGGNAIANGDFNYGWQGWTDGAGNATPAKAKMEVVSVAGPDNGAYLRSYGHMGVDGEASLKGAFDVVAGQPYLFSVWHKDHEGGWQKASLSADGTTENVTVNNLSTATDWAKASATFASGDYSQLIVKYRWLNTTAKFDKFALHRLFTSRRLAFDDGVAQLLGEAEAFKAWNAATNPSCADINVELTSRLGAASAMAHATEEQAQERYETAQTALCEARQGVTTKKTLDSLTVVARAVGVETHPRYAQLQTAIDEAAAATTVGGYATALDALRRALDNYLVWVDVTASLLKNPSFAATDGWTVKAGTYTGGDQRTNNVWGRQCWNAWWSTAADGSLEVKQTIGDLPAGYYAMACVATTQPFCITDQHGYITGSTDTAKTPMLTFERFDAPGITNADVWEPLATVPVWVNQGGTLTVGFVSTKANKQTANPVYTDNREGWWCATDFRLYYVALRGDLNHDGLVNVTDVVMLTSYILGNTALVDSREADLSGDGQVNVTDVVELVNIILDK